MKNKKRAEISALFCCLISVFNQKPAIINSSV